MADTATPTETLEQPAPPPGNRFFEWMRSLDLPREPGWIGGVCAGIAAKLGIDPLIVRGIVVVIAIFGGPALLFYAAAWLLLPDAKNKIHLEEVFRGRFESPVAAIGAIFLLSFLPVTQGFWSIGATYWGEPYWGSSIGRAVWTLFVLGLIVWFIIWIARRASSKPGMPQAYSMPPATDSAFASPSTVAPAAEPSPATAFAVAGDAPLSNAPEDVAAWRAQQARVKAEHTAFRNQQAAEAQRIARERSRAAAAVARAEYAAKRARTKPNTLFTLVVIGSAIIAGALAYLALEASNPNANLLNSSLAVGLAVLALGILINGVRGKRSGGASAVAVLVVITLVVTTVVSAIPRVVFAGNVNDRVTGNETWNSALMIGAGNADIDLTGYFDGIDEGDERFTNPEFPIYVGAGDVTVILPDDEAAQVTVELGDGTVSMPPGDHSALGQDIDGNYEMWGGASVYETFTPGLEPGSVEGDEFERYVIVHVRVGSGDVTIIREPTVIEEMQ